MLQEEIARQIKQARKEEGLTQEQLGEKIGSSKQQVARIEAGKQNISLQLLEKIAMALSRNLPKELLTK
jgi:transcriptional regulator with XRE-family HTH domain